jgi:hypothetical protein
MPAILAPIALLVSLIAFVVVALVAFRMAQIFGVSFLFTGKMSSRPKPDPSSGLPVRVVTVTTDNDPVHTRATSVKEPSQALMALATRKAQPDAARSTDRETVVESAHDRPSPSPDDDRPTGEFEEETRVMHGKAARDAVLAVRATVVSSEARLTLLGGTVADPEPDLSARHATLPPPCFPGNS